MSAAPTPSSSRARPANEVRALQSMVESASTARVLNVARRSAGLRAVTPPHRRLFINSGLDRSIIVKHRLRPHERDWFVMPKRMSTKILVPFDPTDLRFGANCIFVDQKGYDESLTGSLGIDADPESGKRDRAVLAALAELPSLDPFLTREHLQRRGFTVADDYFDISTADIAQMLDFVKQDVVPLVSLCFGKSVDAAFCERLSQKILASELDASMMPLRQTLRMDEVQFVEGIFCWKGFLYYKWVLSDLLASGNGVERAIQEVKSKGEATYEQAAFIPSAKARLKMNMAQAIEDAKSSLQTYDYAFESMTQREDPGAFREFLLAAPGLFFNIGVQLGALQHISSYWNTRYGHGALVLPVGELFDVLADFDSCFSAPLARRDRAA